MTPPAAVWASQLMSFMEVQAAQLKAYKPVEAWEYNLTAAEEEEALAVTEGDDSDGDGDDSSEDASGGDGDDAVSEGEAPALAAAAEEPEAVMNSYKRQALGCALGMGNMPAMCSTYPMARELSWADFWHEYPVRV